MKAAYSETVMFLYSPEYIPFDIFPTRCNITQFIYFWKSALHILYIFWVVSPPIIRSTHNSIYRDTVNRVVCAPDDGWRHHPKHV